MTISKSSFYILSTVISVFFLLSIWFPQRLKVTLFYEGRSRLWRCIACRRERDLNFHLSERRAMCFFLVKHVLPMLLRSSFSCSITILMVLGYKGVAIHHSCPGEEMLGSQDLCMGMVTILLFCFRQKNLYSWEPHIVWFLIGLTV